MTTTSSRGGKKMWCVAEVNAEYVAKMKDVLDTLAKAPSSREPVVALDERPVMLREPARPERPMAPGKLRRPDYEYRRRGTANAYCIVEVHQGRHLTHATRNRKAEAFVKALQRIANEFPDAKKIHLIMDNLNIHCERSVIRILGPKAGRKLWKRFNVHYTPKHASWLNPAEIEASAFARQCLGKLRVGSFQQLYDRTEAWNDVRDRDRVPIKWKYTWADARKSFGLIRRGSKIAAAKH